MIDDPLGGILKMNDKQNLARVRVTNYAVFVFLFVFYFIMLC